MEGEGPRADYSVLLELTTGIDVHPGANAEGCSLRGALMFTFWSLKLAKGPSLKQEWLEVW